MFGECHAHLIMDGENYRKAVAVHANGVQEEDLRTKLAGYAARGICFVRDGGDSHGISARALQLAGEYGITYRTPLFAIHKRGHYGGIVGFPFDTWKEYEQLVGRVRAEGGHFIKIMCSGILDFRRRGALTGPPVEREDIREMIHIAHEEGFSVMAHVNGAKAVLDAVEAGVDSVEHGNFMDEDALQALAESDAVWVPTYVTITNLIGSGRFEDTAIAGLVQEQGERIRRGFELGARIALGSDAGAFRVPHGEGLLDEYREIRRLMLEAGGKEKESFAQFHLTEEELDGRLAEAEEQIRRKF